ncbi:MAG: hypothetical protein WC600_09120 [Desulfobaccales bacterium]
MKTEVADLLFQAQESLAARILHREKFHGFAAARAYRQCLSEQHWI